jgi:PAS domain S-box-containing protein
MSDQDQVRNTAEVATLLKELAPEMLALWEEAARLTLPAAAQQSRPALIDHLPEILEQLRLECANPSIEGGYRFDRAERIHGRQRAHLPEYDLEQVVAEYNLLRRTVVDLLHKHRPLRHEERTVINSVIDRGIQLSAMQYVESHWQDLKQYRILIDGVQDYAICLLDPAGRVSTWNPGAERIHGFTRDEILGKHFSTFYTEVERNEGVPESALRTAAAEGRWETEALRVRKDGSQFWARVIITAIRESDLQVRAYAKVTADLTAPRAAAEALRQRARQQAAVAQLGQDALEPRPLQELMDVAVRRVAETLEVEYCQVLELLPDGEDLLVRSGVGWQQGVLGTARIPAGTETQAGFTLRSEAPIFSHDLRAETRFTASKLLREHGVISDINAAVCCGAHPWGILGAHTRHRRDFNENDINFMQAIANILSSAVARHRLEAELRERLADLKETDQRKSEFLATLGHELRTPLSAICNATYILESIPLEERAQRQVGALGRQARHLTRLVDDLLDISRINTGKVELRQQVIPLVRVVRDAVQATQPLIEGQEHRLTLHIEDDSLAVWGDADRLQQIVANLLNNAAKYTPAGGEIGLAIEREGQHAIIRVWDNGVGIDPEVLPTLFDLFAQVASTRLPAQGGFGIGLALVRQLTELHGGTVSAHSEGLGKGTEFTVRLPLGEST